MSKWETVKLSDIYTLQMGKTPSRNNLEYWNGTNKWLSIADISKAGKYVSETKETISDLAVSESGIKVTPKDTVVMSFKLSIGKIAITAEDIYTNEAIMSFIDRKKYDVDAGFIYHLFSAKDWSEGSNKAVKGITLNKATLSDVEIPLPPLEIQREIAYNLDKASEAIELCRKILEKLDYLVKAKFAEMFGEPVTNPQGWAKEPLASSIIRANNGMARRGNDTDGNIVLRLVELQSGYIDYAKPNRILLNKDEKQRYLLFDGDFLFARVNGNPENVGRCAVYQDIGEPVYHNDHIIRVHFNEKKLNGTFASVLLNSAYGKEQLRSQIKTSAGQYTVSQDGIGNIITILPPLPLQEQFAEYVKKTDLAKSAVKKSLEKAETLKSALMQKYFG